MNKLSRFLIQIFRQQSKIQRVAFFSSLALTGLAAWLEIQVLGLVGPLFSSLGTSEINSGNAVLLMIFALLSAGARILQIRIGHGYVYGIGHLLSVSALKNALSADYIDLKRSHSSVLLKRFEVINIVINSVLTPILILMSSSLLALAISISLFMTDSILAIVGIGAIATFYMIAALLSRKALLQNASTLSHTQGERLFLIREAIEGYRELKIGGQIDNYRSRFASVDNFLRLAQVRNLVIGSTPRFVLEATVFVLLGVLVIWSPLSDNGNGTSLIGVLATFAIGAQRLLPHAQSIYSSISSITGHYDLIAELATPLFEEKSASQKQQRNLDPTKYTEGNTIEFKELAYSYPGSEAPVFRNLNLTIKRGTKAALIGPSGTGKSTFLELFGGLLSPTEGCIEIDNVKLSDMDISTWHSEIAYVPQSPFLLSDTLRENLSLGATNTPIPDDELVEALHAVGLGSWFKHLSEGLEYHVGENGENLSGGQRQRLAIARALVGEKTVLILDEVTSNLDADNEANILALILSLPRRYTIICSLHKAKVLDQFDCIVTFSPTKIECSLPSNMESRS